MAQHALICIKRKNLIIFVAVILIIAVLVAFVSADLFPKKPEMRSKPDLLFGVDVGFGGEEDVYRTVDAVRGYANLIILGSLNVTTNTTTLTRVCDYLYAENFYFIVYIGFAMEDFLPPRGPAQNFFNVTKDRWGDKFLGVYVFDEVGGKQLDFNEKPVNSTHIPDFILDSRHYTYVSESYFVEIVGHTAITLQWFDPPYPYYYMSDYGLYWFDYLSGYGTVFAEFVGNHSKQLAVSMCRGAAHTVGLNPGHSTDQDWGVMITWKYDQPPFLADADELYDDMVLAYKNGARYIIVFNSPFPKNATTPLGILTNEHVNAMKQFWDYAKENPRNEVYPADTAYVLPRDYGFGMRGPDDTIWGLWSADELSPKIWNDANNYIQQYGTALDVVYETRIDHQSIELPYSKLIYWNGTVIQK